MPNLTFKKDFILQIDTERSIFNDLIIKFKIYLLLTLTNIHPSIKIKPSSTKYLAVLPKGLNVYNERQFVQRISPQRTQSS